MESPSNDKWTSDQRSLLVAAYEVTFAEEGRPNWNLLAERYQKAASELDLPFRTTMALRKQWSRTDETHLDPKGVANFSAFIRQYDNAQTPLLSSTNLSRDATSYWNFETGMQVSSFSDVMWPGAQNAQGDESQYYDIPYSQFSNYSAGTEPNHMRHEHHQGQAEEPSSRRAEKGKPIWPSQLLQNQQGQL